jgi:hypothetical protein
MVAAKNFSEWFAFYGGEELGIGRDKAAVVWEAATKAAEALKPSHKSQSTPLLFEYPCGVCGERSATIHKCRQCNGA